MEIEKNYNVTLMANILTNGNVYGIKPASLLEIIGVLLYFLIILAITFLIGESIGISFFILTIFLSFLKFNLFSQIPELINAFKKINFFHIRTVYLMIFECSISIWIYSQYSQNSPLVGGLLLVFWFISGISLILLNTKKFIVSSTSKEFLEICKLYGVSRSSYMWTTLLMVLIAFSSGTINFVIYIIYFVIFFVWFTNSFSYALEREYELLEVKKVLSFIGSNEPVPIGNLRHKFEFSESKLFLLIIRLYSLSLIAIITQENQHFKKIETFTEIKKTKIELNKLTIIK